MHHLFQSSREPNCEARKKQMWASTAQEVPIQLYLLERESPITGMERYTNKNVYTWMPAQI